MPLISEIFHARRLTESGVNIKTTYITDGSLRYRSTDGSAQDDVVHGIRCRKEYYIRGKQVHLEKIFDSRIEYTYVTGVDSEAFHTCENCGFTGKIKEFSDGCPYCGAASNIDYADKDLGSKHHYDLVLKNPLYRILTGVVDYVVSTLLSWWFIVNTSRTFNNYDIAKIFIYGAILSMILYYFFYLCDGYVVLGPVRRYKEVQNRKQQEFWERTGIDQTRFYNNLNYEAGKRYYSMPDVIDFDMIDYTDLQETKRDDVMYVTVKLQVRLVSMHNGKMRAKYQKDSFVLRRNETVYLLEGKGIRVKKCPNCNANMDVTKGKCEYCGAEIGSTQEWLLADETA